MSSKQIELKCKAPIHVQIREIIRSKIEDGEYKPGEEIPPETQLAKLYGLNRLTVRNAITALVNEGLLKRVHGKGLYVTGKMIERNLGELGGFTQTTREKNAVPGRKLLFRTRRPAGIKYAKTFSIAPESEIFYIRRMFLADNEPVSIEDTYIPCDVCPDLENVDLGVFSLYEVFGYNGIVLNEAWQTLSITTLSNKETRLLKLEPETPVLLFEYTSYNTSGRVVEFNRSYTRSDKNRLVVHFNNQNKLDIPENQETNNLSDDYPL